MAKKSSIGITVAKGFHPVSFVPAAFEIRKDYLDRGYIELIFEPLDKGVEVQRVRYDGFFIKLNPRNLNEYLGHLASLNTSPDDNAEKKDIFGGKSHFANMLHVGRVGESTETTFSIVSMHEWATLKEDTSVANKVLETRPVLALYCSPSFQMKLVAEIVAAFSLKH